MNVALTKTGLNIKKILNNKKTLILLLVVALTLVAVYFAANVEADPDGWFKGIKGGGSDNFMAAGIKSVKWLVCGGVLIGSIILFFTKTMNDINISTVVMHILATVIVLWLAWNFTNIAKNSTGAMIDNHSAATRTIKTPNMKLMTPNGIPLE